MVSLNTQVFFKSTENLKKEIAIKESEYNNLPLNYDEAKKDKLSDEIKKLKSKLQQRKDQAAAEKFDSLNPKMGFSKLTKEGRRSASAAFQELFKSLNKQGI